jgi:succinyl-CoA:acetate CoA-transferase
MKLRIPYQSHPDIRRLVNQGKLNFIDMHLSHVGRYIKEGIFPPIDVAIIEACDVTSDGRIYLREGPPVNRVTPYSRKI